MYIPYEKIGNFLSRFFKSESLKTFFCDKKMAQNLRYIKKNKQEVLKKLRNKLKNKQKINVVFYVYDETKWKCQSVYELLASDERFSVKVLVTRSAAKNSDNPTYQSNEDIIKTYKFFKDKGMNVELAYDIVHQKFKPFKQYSPDIIFYQHPWYVETSQGPVVCSKFALTAYIPYYFPLEVGNIDNKIDYNLRFHKYVELYYVLDKTIEQKFKQKAGDLGSKIRTAGYPQLDNITNTGDTGEYIIYAPHWTVGGTGLKYGSFEWSGKFLLDYAKNHPETKWVFKPHPLLYKTLISSGLMTKEEADEYYNAWAETGVKYEGGDYIEWFNKSKMMLTDSCTFLGEYFVTEKPLIILMAENSPFKSLEHPILETYYCAKNVDELEHYLKILPAEDNMKEKRLSALEKLNLKNNNASKSIVCDILKEIGEDYA